LTPRRSGKTSRAAMPRQSMTMPPPFFVSADGSHSLSKRIVAPEAVIWR
jgi:hypothetical protein